MWTSYCSVVEDVDVILLRRVLCVLLGFFLLSLIPLSDASLRLFQMKRFHDGHELQSGRTESIFYQRDASKTV